MSNRVYINGNLLPKEQAVVSVFDHGFLYGDGVFEGIRVYGGKVFLLREHVDRLYDSARSIGLDIPISRADMTDALLDTALAKATELAAMPPKAIQAMKRLLRHTDVPSIKDIRKLENDTLFARIGTPENNEAIRAFFEKRAPDFTNLPDE